MRHATHRSGLVADLRAVPGCFIPATTHFGPRRGSRDRRGCVRTKATCSKRDFEHWASRSWAQYETATLTATVADAATTFITRVFQMGARSTMGHHVLIPRRPRIARDRGARSDSASSRGPRSIQGRRCCFHPWPRPRRTSSTISSLFAGVTSPNSRHPIRESNAKCVSRARRREKGFMLRGGQTKRSHTTARPTARRLPRAAARGRIGVEQRVPHGGEKRVRGALVMRRETYVEHASTRNSTPHCDRRDAPYRERSKGRLPSTRSHGQVLNPLAQHLHAPTSVLLGARAWAGYPSRKPHAWAAPQAMSYMPCKGRVHPPQGDQGAEMSGRQCHAAARRP